MGLFSVLMDKLSEVQQNNRESQDQKTAPSEVFDRMKKKLENLETNRNQQQSTTGQGGGLLSSLQEKLEEVRNENRESAEEDTADDVVFDDMLAKLEEFDAEQKKQSSIETEVKNRANNSNMESGEEFGSIFDKLENTSNTDQPSHSNNSNNNKESGYNDSSSYNQPSDSGNIERGGRSLQIGGMAMTESNGGSLSMRVDPVMGAGTIATRVPHGANLRILEYTDKNKINIDGQVSGWYKVDFNGQQGWILEMYLR